ncbi:MAG TPA: outer membrane beta-barrel protein [Saprospiraceae bacterium]|nr:outer membrane beta-barrel protein [Saprospiraceae bacterium]MCB9328617.1 outer membrane beta-barrel protein [Lewinellaceae bacterium]HRX29263.1 outer membrane beta-barrel protein [Saprospiraceae bacterium]
MKKIFIIVFLSCVHWTITNTLAQNSNYFGVKGGYLLNGSIQLYEGYIDIGPSPEFGLVIGREFGNAAMEFEYTFAASSELEYFGNPYYNTDYQRSDLTIHIFQLNRAVQYFAENDLRPYSIFGLGAIYFDAKDFGSKTFFGVNFGAGAKYDINDNVRLRFQGRFILPLVFEGGGLFLGIDSGGVSPGVSVYSNSPILQGDFSLGFDYRFQ